MLHNLVFAQKIAPEEFAGLAIPHLHVYTHTDYDEKSFTW